MLEEQLKKFGLSEKEAKTYITLLVLGESTANEVAKESGVNRSSAYVVLEALQKKGLVKASEGTKIQKFRAAPPEMLAQIAATQLKKQQDIHEAVKDALPSLKGVSREHKHSPTVKVFEGVEGLMSSFEDTLLSREKIIRVASSAKNIAKLLPKMYFPKYIMKRKKAGIKMLSIHPHDKFAEKLLKSVSMSGDEAYFVPPERFKFSADIAVWDDKIGYMAGEDGGISILIQHKDMAEMMKDLFNLALEEAKQISTHDTK